MKKWILLVVVTAIALYWSGNVLLWYPWSINEDLGVALMLTLAPLIGGVGMYFCLRRYPGRRMYTGALIVSFEMFLIAGILDFVFLGIIRGAYADLYKPATSYGNGFLITGCIGLVSLLAQVVLVKP